MIIRDSYANDRPILPSPPLKPPGFRTTLKPSSHLNRPAAPPAPA